MGDELCAIFFSVNPRTANDVPWIHPNPAGGGSLPVETVGSTKGVEGPERFARRWCYCWAWSAIRLTREDGLPEDCSVDSGGKPWILLI